jgi:hypothetical protein
MKYSIFYLLLLILYHKKEEKSIVKYKGKRHYSALSYNRKWENVRKTQINIDYNRQIRHINVIYISIFYHN